MNRVYVFFSIILSTITLDALPTPNIITANIKNTLLPIAEDDKLTSPNLPSIIVSETLIAKVIKFCVAIGSDMESILL